MEETPSTSINQRSPFSSTQYFLCPPANFMRGVSPYNMKQNLQFDKQVSNPFYDFGVINGQTTPILQKQFNSQISSRNVSPTPAVRRRDSKFMQEAAISSSLTGCLSPLRRFCQQNSISGQIQGQFKVPQSKPQFTKADFDALITNTQSPTFNKNNIIQDAERGRSSTISASARNQQRRNSNTSLLQVGSRPQMSIGGVSPNEDLFMTANKKRRSTPDNMFNTKSPTPHLYKGKINMSMISTQENTPNIAAKTVEKCNHFTATSSNNVVTTQVVCKKIIGKINLSKDLLAADQEFKKIQMKSAVIGGPTQAMLRCVKQNTSMQIDDGQKKLLYKKLVKNSPEKKKSLLVIEKEEKQENFAQDEQKQNKKPKDTSQSIGTGEKQKKQKIVHFTPLISGETPTYEQASDKTIPKAVKKCNCSRTKCLKLYCECFARGETCSPGTCGCQCCENTSDNEEKRAASKKEILKRDPQAFDKKVVGQQKGSTAPIIAGSDSSQDLPKPQLAQSHRKGCTCKRSGCKKNYCECFQFGVACNDQCKCMGCQNCFNKDGKKETTITTATTTTSLIQQLKSQDCSSKQELIQQDDQSKADIIDKKSDINHLPCEKPKSQKKSKDTLVQPTSSSEPRLLRTRNLSSAQNSDSKNQHKRQKLQ